MREIDHSSPVEKGICREDAMFMEDSSSPQRGEAGVGERWCPNPIPPALLTIVRNLRLNMTDAESLLWKCIRGKQLDGFKFRKHIPANGMCSIFTVCPLN